MWKSPQQGSAGSVGPHCLQAKPGPPLGFSGGFGQQGSRIEFAATNVAQVPIMVAKSVSLYEFTSNQDNMAAIRNEFYRFVIIKQERNSRICNDVSSYAIKPLRIIDKRKKVQKS